MNKINSFTQIHSPSQLSNTEFTQVAASLQGYQGKKYSYIKIVKTDGEWKPQIYQCNWFQSVIYYFWKPEALRVNNVAQWMFTFLNKNNDNLRNLDSKSILKLSLNLYSLRKQNSSLNTLLERLSVDVREAIINKANHDAEMIIRKANEEAQAIISKTNRKDEQTNAPPLKKIKIADFETQWPGIVSGKGNDPDFSTLFVGGTWNNYRRKDPRANTFSLHNDPTPMDWRPVDYLPFYDTRNDERAPPFLSTNFGWPLANYARPNPISRSDRPVPMDWRPIDDFRSYDGCDDGV